MFEAPARIAMKCTHCELDLGSLERGGRFAGMFTAIVAIILILIALGIDSVIAPPMWLQFAFWAPVTVLGVIFALRLFKTLLLYAAFEKQKTPSE